LVKAPDKCNLGLIMARTPIHPGEQLAEELSELGISAAEAAQHLDMRERHLTDILKGKEPVTSDVAARLADWFGTSPQFWLNLQQLYELRLTRAPSA
jgi:antitoxin HigA-1